MPQLEQESGRAGRRPALPRRGIQIAGEPLVTAGVVLLLFVACQLWWTNVDADARQHDVIKDFPETGSTPRPARATMCTCSETAR